MEDLNKKVIGNAVSAYFMIFVSIFFLMSKKPYINHPFVKSHVKSAFSLHILMALMLFIMSYPFLNGIHVLGYSINTIITAILSLFIFAGILYGMFMAHRGKTVTLGEIFHSAGTPKNLIFMSQSAEISEENSLHLILAHIPFIGYIIYPRDKHLAHIRDIVQLNFFLTLVSTLIFIAGYASLASLAMLSYIIYSAFQSIRLTLQGEISTLNLDIMPTIEEKYILQKSLLTYVGNNLRKNTFIPLKEIIKNNTLFAQKREQDELGAMKGKYGFHIKNSIILILLALIIIITLGWNSPVLILFLFPICYSIGYAGRKAYRMPYIYDIYSLFAKIFYSISHVFLKARRLQKTQIQETIKMGEQENTHPTK